MAVMALLLPCTGGAAKSSSAGRGREKRRTRYSSCRSWSLGFQINDQAANTHPQSKQRIFQLYHRGHSEEAQGRDRSDAHDRAHLRRQVIDRTAVNQLPDEKSRLRMRTAAPGSLREPWLSPLLCAAPRLGSRGVTDRSESAVLPDALPILSNSGTTAESRAAAAPHHDRAYRCERHLGW